MIKNFIKTFTRKIFPKGSKVDTKLKNIGVYLRLVEPQMDFRYRAWTIETEPSTFSPILIKQEITFTIVTPAYNTPQKYLEPLIYSVINQTYDNWQWIIINASNINESSKLISSIGERDTRIKVIKTDNKGISGNTNLGLKAATGDYVVLLDHDDTLAPEALNELAVSINKNNQPELLYSDEDKLTESGDRRHLPHLKNTFSIDQLRNLNYITHITAIKKTYLDKIGYLDTKFDGAQDYDLMLRAADGQGEIIYVPKVLYHWREAESSTASDFSVKPEVLSAGVEALQDHLNRNKIDAKAEAIQGKPGFYRINFNNIDTEVHEIIGSPSQHQVQNSKSQYILITDDHTTKANNWQKNITGLMDQDPEVGAVAPIVINQYHQIVDAGQIQKIKTKLFYGANYPSNTYFGDTDWMRRLDESGSTFVTTKQLLEDYFMNHKTFSITEFSKHVRSHKKRIVLWGVDPWIRPGRLIRERNKSLISDMSVFKGYGNVKG